MENGRKMKLWDFVHVAPLNGSMTQKKNITTPDLNGPPFGPPN